MSESAPEYQNQRIAVLIDADNTSPSHATAILEELARYGVPTVKRAYGDWTTQNLVGWKAELPQHAIQPMQQFANTSGKNSTDSALIIDAMDLLYSGSLDAFAIVSSDSDFTRLAGRLRESGKTVYGLGQRKTPAALINACDRFFYLDLLRGASDGKDAGPEDTGAAPPPIEPILRSAVESLSPDEGAWVHLSALGSYLTKTNASFDSRDYGHTKLSALARSQGYLEVEQKNGRVRLRPTTPARKPAAKKSAKKSSSGS